MISPSEDSSLHVRQTSSPPSVSAQVWVEFQLHRCRRLTALVLLLLHLSLSPPLLPLILRPSPSPSSTLSVRPSLRLLHFLRRSLSLHFPALFLSLSHSLSLALFLSSFHAALGLPKRLGLNGENLLWYNELGERQRGGEVEGGQGRMRGCCLDTGGEGRVSRRGSETRGKDSGMQMHAGMEKGGHQILKN